MRRQDKLKVIMEANQRLGRTYLSGKGFSTEDFNQTTFDISEETYTTILIDSLNENNIEHNIIIKKGKN